MSHTPFPVSVSTYAQAMGWLGLLPNKPNGLPAGSAERLWIAGGTGAASANDHAERLPNGAQWMRNDGASQEKIGGTWYSRLLQGVASVADIMLGDTYRVIFGDGSDVTATWGGSSLDILPAADDTLIKLGNGTLSFDLTLFGNTATTYAGWDASVSLLGLYGPARTSGFNAISPRYELKWVAGARGKPGLNADINSATEATREIADPDFEILGTNATSGSTSYDPEGGIKLTTAGADGDSVILLPHLDANQTAWTGVTWGTDKETVWETEIVTGASVAACILYAGLKLTNTDVVATDNDQVFLRYEAGVNSGKFQVISSVGGTDTSADSGVGAAVSTAYHVKIVIASTRIASVYLNGVLVGTSAALTNATDLIPYVGVKASTAAAKVVTVRGEAIARNPG